MNKPSSTTLERPHTQSRRQGLALVVDQQHHPLDDDVLIQNLVDAVATGDRQQIVESAKRFNAPLPELLSVEQIAMKFNLCTRSIWRLVAKGELPQPVLVGSARRWFESEVTAYLAKQTAKRDGINRRRGC